jgi:PleD family two-component response regulator
MVDVKEKGMTENTGAKQDDERILVIEDSHTQALRLQALLEREGLDVVLAFDGKAGVEMAGQLRPAVIILDIQMPEMDGFQVCKQLKEADDTAGIPIIMLTCRDGHEAVLEGLQVGAVDYIPKDAFSDAVLLETLRQMGLIAAAET